MKLLSSVLPLYCVRAEEEAQLPARCAVVVVGQGQLMTAIVLRGLGWEVTLAGRIEDGSRIVRESGASLLFVRISHSPLKSLRWPMATGDVKLVAIVDSSEDAPLPGFDASVEVGDVNALAAYIRSVAPTAPPFAAGWV